MGYQNIFISHSLTAQSINMRHSHTTQIKVSTIRFQYINVVHLITALKI